jgi:uncharacterized protein YndB with AHSA1/START domain
MNDAENKTILTTPGDREIVTERIFEASRERVFDAMTNPELIPLWWGPREMAVIVDKMEVVVGGAWRFVNHNDDGTENGFRGTYREISPPERIVQTFEWEGMPGHVVIETATLEDLGVRTKLTIVSLFHTTEERDGMFNSGMERGVSESHSRLDELLAGSAG